MTQSQYIIVTKAILVKVPVDETWGTSMSSDPANRKVLSQNVGERGRAAGGQPVRMQAVKVPRELSGAGLCDDRTSWQVLTACHQ